MPPPTTHSPAGQPVGDQQPVNAGRDSLGYQCSGCGNSPVESANPQKSWVWTSRLTSTSVSAHGRRAWTMNCWIWPTGSAPSQA